MGVSRITNVHPFLPPPPPPPPPPHPPLGGSYLWDRVHGHINRSVVDVAARGPPAKLLRPLLGRRDAPATLVLRQDRRGRGHDEVGPPAEPNNRRERFVVAQWQLEAFERRQLGGRPMTTAAAATTNTATAATNAAAATTAVATVAFRRVRRFVGLGFRDVCVVRLERRPRRVCRRQRRVRPASNGG